MPKITTTRPTTATTRPALRTQSLSPESRRAYRLRLSVVFHADLERIGSHSDLGEWAEGQHVRWSEPLEVGRDQPVLSDNRPLDDPFVSRRAFALSLVPGGQCVEELACRIEALPGSDCRIGPGQNTFWVADASALARGVPIRLGHGVVLLLRMIAMDDWSVAGRSCPGVIGASPETGLLSAQIVTAARTDLPVLILGESGSGKEVTAKALHQASRRSARSFVAVNMGALSPELSAAELFGCTKGAYTGAEERKGYIRSADHGTLFLDEIADTPQVTQTQLLRFLEQGDIQVVGGRWERADVRVVAATDGSVCAEDGFRHALLTRLSAFRIALCPLRSRLEDIGPQALRALVDIPREETRFPVEEARGDPDVAAHWGRFFFQALLRGWAGNSRELGQVVDRAGRDDPEYTPVLSRQYRESGSHTVASGYSGDELAMAYRRCHYDKAATAIALGLSRATVHRRIKEHPDLVLVEDLSDRQIVDVLERCDDLETAAFQLGVSARALRPRLRHLSVAR